MTTTDTGCPARGTGDTAAATHVTPQGAAWLASAAPYPRSTLALWQARPTAPAVLPCGTAFDIVNVPVVLGRRMLDLLWSEGPGSGPVAVHRGRMLLFASVGTAHRLPSLLDWEEWADAVPTPLCHGRGDAVTVPPLTAAAGPARWLVAPDARRPWLPGADALLWACVRAARSQAQDRPRGGTQAGPRGQAPGQSQGRARTCGYRFFVPPTGMLMSTTSAGAASSVG
ncbi:bifunctional DNA primase/polymerase [Streptomyces sp. WAC06614]|uniref:bifunctional DNA primase/polymerase n=1 Tax=Streptomyces sp. WAC06614 TaxID=2487416 RepID=UPI0021AE547F|nr:bifunctional DNA primase/polymerase [Streptomyces sp. WAC06614]